MSKTRSARALLRGAGLASACLALVLTATACTSKNATSSTSSTAAGKQWPATGTPGGGGNLVIATDVEPTDLSPGAVATNSSSVGVMGNVYETLVGRDANNNLSPRLALSWKQVSDTEWEFTLRQGVKFTDGTPFNAASAVTALTYIWNPALTGVGNFVGPATKFTAAGDYTVDATAVTPDPILPVELTQMPIASPELIANPKSMTGTADGTGPYEVVTWNHGQDIKLKLNTASYLASPGMFDTVDWQFRAEPSVRSQMVQTGEADIVNNLTPDGCKSAAANGGSCQTTFDTNWIFFRPDSCNQVVLGSPLVRQAFAMAINRAAINQAYENGAPVLDNGGPASSIGNPSSVKYAYNPDEAKKLLAQAAAEGINTKLPLTIKYSPSAFPNQDLIAAAMQSDLAKVGFNVTVKSVDLPTFLAESNVNVKGTSSCQTIPKDRGDILINRTGNEFFDLSLTGHYVLTCAAKKSSICDPNIDAAYNKALPLTGSARASALADMWSIAYKEVALLPLAQETVNYAESNRVKVTPQTNNIIPLWKAKALK